MGAPHWRRKPRGTRGGWSPGIRNPSGRGGTAGVRARIRNRSGRGAAGSSGSRSSSHRRGRTTPKKSKTRKEKRHKNRPLRTPLQPAHRSGQGVLPRTRGRGFGSQKPTRIAPNPLFRRLRGRLQSIRVTDEGGQVGRRQPYLASETGTKTLRPRKQRRTAGGNHYLHGRSGRDGQSVYRRACFDTKSRIDQEENGCLGSGNPQGRRRLSRRGLFEREWHHPATPDGPARGSRSYRRRDLHNGGSQRHTEPTIGNAQEFEHV
mmetsp:Transcript_84837/g.172016  ORF Transcript_84837/g.172016 Transcript_84837/m.172016 type:complete len:262 (-) Transcript_84837:689-1474(-)